MVLPPPLKCSWWELPKYVSVTYLKDKALLGRHSPSAPLTDGVEISPRCHPRTHGVYGRVPVNPAWR